MTGSDPCSITISLRRPSLTQVIVTEFDVMVGKFAALFCVVGLADANLLPLTKAYEVIKVNLVDHFNQRRERKNQRGQRPAAVQFFNYLRII
jgi:hypothetical protein